MVYEVKQEDLVRVRLALRSLAFKKQVIVDETPAGRFYKLIEFNERIRCKNGIDFSVRQLLGTDTKKKTEEV